MQLTIDVQNDDKLEKLLLILKELNMEFSLKKKPTAKRKIPIVRGDKSVDPEAMFGIWKDNPITLAEIRERNWNRNSSPEK